MCVGNNFFLAFHFSVWYVVIIIKRDAILKKRLSERGRLVLPHGSATEQEEDKRPI